MESCAILLGCVKRLTGFTVAALAIVVLAGPILGIVVTLGVFALIGFLLWLPLHTVFCGPHSSWRSTCEGAKKWRRHMAACVRSTDDRCHAFGVRVADFVRWCWPRVRRVGVEAFCGAAVGVLIVVLTGAQEAPAVAAVAVGLTAGALLGLFGE